MWRKIAIILPILILAFVILTTSILRTASVKYDFKGTYNLSVLGDKDLNIDYQLPYPGRVLPDSPLWPLKAIRDKIWFWITSNPTRRSELKLLFADKRLGSAKILFERGNSEVGLSTLTKAEKYLEEASILEEENRRNGIDTSEFLQTLAKASLKHYEVMQEIIEDAPENVKPLIISSEDYAKRTYEQARNSILEKGQIPPENPFNW